MVGPPQHRLVRAGLAVDAGHPITTETLIDRVWDEAPAGARRTLHVAIARLRRVLEQATGRPAPLTRRSGGYLLDIDPDEVDALRLRGVLGKQAPSAERLDDVLTLWRGEPLAGLPGQWAARVRGALLHDCLSATVAWALAETAAGNAEAALARLVEADAAHPLVEPVAAALMRVLHAAGRTADALEHYATVRRRLRDELGADPGPGLRDALLPGGDAARVAVITGPGGVGKTWLATQWAQRHRDAFPDGQLFAELRGFDPTTTPLPPGGVVRSLLEALGVPQRALPSGPEAPVGLYRSLVADRRVLIVLDNARDSAQVAPLLPGTGAGAVLVTSRDRLTGLIAAHAATAVPLAVLDDAAAHELLRRRLDDSTMGREPGTAEAVVTACAGLPLALGIAAARAGQQPHLGLAAVAAELRDAATRLNALEGDAVAGLRTVLATTVAALTGPQRRAFALLGVAAGPDISAPAAAALLNERPGPAVHALEQLSLLHQRVPGRWRMHDLVRLYAVELAGDPALTDRREALRQLTDFLSAQRGQRGDADGPRPGADPAAQTGRRRVPADPPGIAAALAWIGDEYDNLCATQHLAAEHGWDDAVWQLAWSMDNYHHRLGRAQDEVAVWEAGLAAAERLSRPGPLIAALRLMSSTYVKVGNHAAGIACLQRALCLAEAAGDLLEQARHASTTRSDSPGTSRATNSALSTAPWTPCASTNAWTSRARWLTCTTRPVSIWSGWAGWTRPPST